MQKAESFKSLGTCGEFFYQNNQARVKSLLFQAAEQRQLAKARRLGLDFEKLSQEAQEQALFELVMTSLGYSQYKESFLALAQDLPLVQVNEILKGPESKAKLLGHWAGRLGLLEASSVHECYQKDWAQMRAYRAPLRHLVVVKGRPSNHPLKRLAGLYYHLLGLGSEPWMKVWLRFFFSAEKHLAQEKRPLPKIVHDLDQLFGQAPNEPLAQLESPQSQKIKPQPERLLGASRQRVILINALMPFFLAWSQSRGDRNLERTLFSLFLILPAEGENHKTLAMEARLGLASGRFKKNLSYHQGLIHFYDQLCQPAYPDCLACSLPNMIKNGG